MLPRSAYASDEEFRAALRDMFAGQAIAGMLGNIDLLKGLDKVKPSAPRAAAAEIAYAFADAMLEARDRIGGGE